jgi:hypothetical protein
MADESDNANGTPDARWERVNALFHAAVARPLGERAAFLATECSGDDEFAPRSNRRFQHTSRVPGRSRSR